MPGRYIVMAFLSLSTPRDAIQAVMSALAEHEALFDDTHRCFFGVLKHPQLIASAENSIPGIRWFLDPDGDLFRKSEMCSDDGVDESGWILLDPSLRVMKTAPLSDTVQVLCWVRDLPSVDDHAGVRLTAPVLIMPRVLEPELCEKLIDWHRRNFFQAQVIHNQNGVVSELYVDKTYRSALQASITGVDLRERIEDRLLRRLAPEVLGAFRYRVRYFDYFIACYDAAEQGRFRAHRDNLPPYETRQFTFVVNLNGDYDGGELRFPEFGTATYRASEGGAIVFASSLLHEVTVVTRGRRYAMPGFLVDQPADSAIRPYVGLEPTHEPTA